MAFGFDPARFRVNLQQTPVWAAQDRVWARNVTGEQRQMLENQKPRISREVGGALQWAMTDPAANAAFQFRHTYSDGVKGDYFMGRQYLEADPEQEWMFFIETECCLTRSDPQHLPEIYERFNVLLHWDAIRTVGRLTLAEETEHGARLGLPNFRLVRTLRARL
ncbi:hypothetical protein [Deinococcus marmoris]|uniref:hypothetical protein n=1 Tax=Deinococcus marmoris TaxID=249408 RepID=UPI000497C552|nr:hypothetical protein [Deinococcus marmoris]